MEALWHGFIVSIFKATCKITFSLHSYVWKRILPAAATPSVRLAASHGWRCERWMWWYNWFDSTTTPPTTPQFALRAHRLMLATIVAYLPGTPSNNNHSNNSSDEQQVKKERKLGNASSIRENTSFTVVAIIPLLTVVHCRIAVRVFIWRIPQLVRTTIFCGLTHSHTHTHTRARACRIANKSFNIWNEFVKLLQKCRCINGYFCLLSSLVVVCCSRIFSDFRRFFFFARARKVGFNLILMPLLGLFLAFPFIHL